MCESCQNRCTDYCERFDLEFMRAAFHLPKRVRVRYDLMCQDPDFAHVAFLRLKGRGPDGGMDAAGKIAVIVENSSWYGRRILDGVAAYARREQQWSLVWCNPRGQSFEHFFVI